MSDVPGLVCLTETPTCQVLHLSQPDAPFTLVTFDVMHARANGRTAFGLGLARKLGLNFYGVVPTGPNWYPARDAEQAARVIRDHAMDGPIVAYGASMGAYGVLRYGPMIGADAIMAFAPQATIDPATCGAHDRRYAKYFDAAAHAEMAPDTDALPAHTFVIVDSGFAPDAYQLSLLEHGRHTIELPFMGHQIAAAMTPSRNAMANFKDALAGRADRLQLRLRKGARQTEAHKLGEAAVLLQADAPDRALDLISDVMVNHGRSERALILFGRACLAAGNPALAIADLEGLVAEKPHQIVTRRLLADLHAAAGHPAQAIAHLSDALHRSPNSVMAVRLSRLLNTHDRGQAVTFDAAARERWPECAEKFVA